jgi:hypothetical protein
MVDPDVIIYIVLKPVFYLTSLVIKGKVIVTARVEDLNKCKGKTERLILFLRAFLGSKLC